ncbi:MAG TPA: hypothetical protein VGJ16_12360 [Pirellulales bacterium]|jgi:hypothetical protein
MANHNNKPLDTSAAPTEAWLFARDILGRDPQPPNGKSSGAPPTREQLEWLAKISPRYAEELRRVKNAEAAARHDRELLQWAAQISSHAEERLRAVERAEAAQGGSRDSMGEINSIGDETGNSMTSSWLDEWQEPDHPRDRIGRFTSKGNRRKGFLGSVIGRNQKLGDALGNMTPEMIASSRLAATLHASSRLPGEVAAAAAGGLSTGSKAIVNGSATAVKNVATLGLSSSQLELIGVTKQDRQFGYDSAVKIATASGEVLIAVGTSGLSTALSKGGTVARTASGALVAYDTAGNAVGTVQGAYDALQNGVNLENGLKIAGGALGLAGNAKAARDLRQAASAAELARVEAYIAKCPRTPTPTRTPANQYEIAHTGPHNYGIAGGGETFQIDGYQGTTILEAKHVGDVKSSPYVPGTTFPASLRAKILSEEREKLERVRTIIRSGKTPFKSIEIITNTPESKTLFEGMLKDVGLPGTVRIAI